MKEGKLDLVSGEFSVPAELPEQTASRSRRAKIILQQMGIVQPGEEVVGVNKVLNAAALTYVAAFIAALGNLLWLMSIRDRR